MTTLLGNRALETAFAASVQTEWEPTYAVDARLDANHFLEAWRSSRAKSINLVLLGKLPGKLLGSLLRVANLSSKINDKKVFFFWQRALECIRKYGYNGAVSTDEAVSKKLTHVYVMLQCMYR